MPTLDLLSLVWSGCTYINFFIVVAGDARLHLGGNIVGRAQTASKVAFKIGSGRRAHGCRELATGSETKISNTGIIRHVDEDIVWLEIPMNNSMAVDMAQSVQDLPEQAPGPVNIIVQTISYQIAKGLCMSASVAYC